jgi:hypothetical protein
MIVCIVFQFATGEYETNGSGRKIPLDLRYGKFFLAGGGGMPQGAKNSDANLYGSGQRPVICEYGTKLSYTAII